MRIQRESGGVAAGAWMLRRRSGPEDGKPRLVLLDVADVAVQDAQTVLFQRRLAADGRRVRQAPAGNGFHGGAGALHLHALRLREVGLQVHGTLLQRLVLGKHSADLRLGTEDPDGVLDRQHLHVDDPDAAGALEEVVQGFGYGALDDVLYRHQPAVHFLPVHGVEHRFNGNVRHEIGLRHGGPGSLLRVRSLRSQVADLHSSPLAMTIAPLTWINLNARRGASSCGQA